MQVKSVNAWKNKSPRGPRAQRDLERNLAHWIRVLPRFPFSVARRVSRLFFLVYLFSSYHPKSNRFSSWLQ